MVRQSFFYSPTDAQMSCLQTILKFTLQQIRHVSVQSHRHQGAHFSCFLNLQFLKQSIILHRGAVNTVVMWLRVLVSATHQLNCIEQFSENIQITMFMKIFTLESEFFHVDGNTD